MSDSTLAPDTQQDLYALCSEGQKLLFSEAKTAYDFSDEPVGDDRLQAIYELFKWAPTSANINPLRILYVRTEAGKQRLLTGVAKPNQEQTAGAPVTAVLAADTQYPEYVPFLAPSNPQLREMLEANQQLRESQMDFNAVLQAGYFVLAVRAAGLAAGPMKGFNAQAVDQEFFPDGRWKSVLLVNIGFPSATAFRDRLPRPSYDQAVQLA
ncbi:malonic semialdehyde reductase [Streptomyces sp. NPDC088350]|uniref:malonic semialdehyde reductase n=1 Tax=Streptomyces sp. NPDC088350 TaxID=3365854 RepID=UPI0037FB16F2